MKLHDLMRILIANCWYYVVYTGMNGSKRSMPDLGVNCGHKSVNDYYVILYTMSKTNKKKTI
jgi:hypothetical protein